VGDEVYTELGIYSEMLSLDELNSILGIACDKGWNKGDLRTHTIIRQQKNAWIIRSTLPRSASLESHVKDLITRIAPLKDKIKQVSDQACVEFSCVIHSKERPALNFDQEMIKVLSELGACLDIDLYIHE